VAYYFAGQIFQRRRVKPEKSQEFVGNPGMQDRKSGQLIYPKPVTIYFLVLPGVDEGGVRRIGGGAENGVRGEHTALKGIKDSFASQRFDHASGIADVQQVPVRGLNWIPGQWGDRLPAVFGGKSEFLIRILAKSFCMLRTANQA
jgi:hypothetical protein